ncbi:MAG TPA: hypothetical protein VMW24_09530 [Sedimentisphaerales bacterium]|nr:hypothetical protein [Sedimentisphaerales bacterium]
MPSRGGIMLRYLMVVFLLILKSSGPLSAQAGQGGGDAAVMLSGPEEALQRALAYTGFEEARYVKMVAAAEMGRLVVAHDSTLPFLADSVSGRQVWEVAFASLSYLNRCDSEVVLSCTVWLDPSDGAFLVARFFPLWDSVRRSAMPSGKHIEERLNGSMFTYGGKARDLPRTTLLDALRGVLMSSRCDATETVAWHLLLGRRDSDAEPEPYWCIVDRGVPFEQYASPRGQRLPEGLTANNLHLYNANSSQIRAAMTVH